MKRRQKKAKDAPGMRGSRSRVKSSGKLRRKRNDTKIGTLQQIYHRTLGKDGLQLGTLLKRKHKRSLKRLVKPKKKSR
ncbi:MAG: hypothetical protein HY220_02150 [Candidatus Sungbacteria bacterium]|uniref:Uncharacterized protein n=1 Tax=Candidatus Sungiibacteriota bacterium TaxID=2750080 RepID=A0A9D6LR49_9BACT|nr:hypothetical protein [Candidatus Sungbacteria bacterium]